MDVQGYLRRVMGNVIWLSRDSFFVTSTSVGNANTVRVWPIAPPPKPAQCVLKEAGDRTQQTITNVYAAQRNT